MPPANNAKFSFIIIVETFKKIYTTKNYVSSDNRFNMESTIIKSSRIYNVDVSNIIGSKTGFTYDAGQCLAALLNIYDTNFILNIY